MQEQYFDLQEVVTFLEIRDFKRIIARIMRLMIAFHFHADPLSEKLRVQFPLLFYKTSLRLILELSEIKVFNYFIIYF